MSDLEAVWIEQALNGDDDAFAQLVETYQKPVYNLCYRMLGESQEAEDAAQESFWRAYQALNRYDTKRKVFDVAVVHCGTLLYRPAAQKAHHQRADGYCF